MGPAMSTANLGFHNFQNGHLEASCSVLPRQARAQTLRRLPTTVYLSTRTPLKNAGKPEWDGGSSKLLRNCQVACGHQNENSGCDNDRQQRSRLPALYTGAEIQQPLLRYRALRVNGDWPTTTRIQRLETSLALLFLG